MIVKYHQKQINKMLKKMNLFLKNSSNELFQNETNFRYFIINFITVANVSK